ncbi:hypothetical protein V9T40_010862 [Parthenolecanium corni]|uniref:Nuclear receptor domain-containing protein n=1 Tax=Parthenolecanium corni TaxID=536013 RepID=A0AAN9XXK9_9HEMI
MSLAPLIVRNAHSNRILVFSASLLQSFFGRTYNNMNSISECKNNNDCIINKKNRTSCKSCRLRKCLVVGMSKSGSRYGRRSNWFKIHCLLQEQGSSVAPNGLGGGFANGSLYPGLFNARHMLSADKFLETRLNGFSPFSDSKHFLNDLEKYRTSSEDSGGSSAGDMDDESRSTSAASRAGGPALSHQQTPSPFSEKEFNNHHHHHHHHHHHPKKLSITVPSSPPSHTTAPSPFTSPPGHPVYTSPYVSPTLRPLPQYHLPFPVTRPGITPAPANLVFLDSLANPAMAMRTGGDLLSFSPAAGGVAVEQDQPIDLSVKSSSLGGDSPKARSSSRTSSASPKSVVDEDEPDAKNVKTVHIPLDLTSKRVQGLTTHSS